jgi:hypothetical protein
MVLSEVASAPIWSHCPCMQLLLALRRRCHVHLHLRRRRLHIQRQRVLRLLVVLLFRARALVWLVVTPGSALGQPTAVYSWSVCGCPTHRLLAASPRLAGMQLSHAPLACGFSALAAPRLADPALGWPATAPRPAAAGRTRAACLWLRHARCRKNAAITAAATAAAARCSHRRCSHRHYSHRRCNNRRCTAHSTPVHPPRLRCRLILWYHARYAMHHRRRRS